MADEVTTWADGFGAWRASVPLTDSRQRDAMTARKAILAELEARYVPGFDPHSIRVTRESVTNHGTAIYREDLAR